MDQLQRSTLKQLGTFIEGQLSRTQHSINNILELGMGDYPVLLDSKDESSKWWGVDLNVTSCSDGSVTFIGQDAMSFELEDKVDLALDCFLFHCLKTKEEAKIYLENIYSKMAKDGLFLLQVATTTPTLKKILPPYFFENNLLYKEEKDGIKFRRLILPTFELEKIFNSVGFKIDYFCIGSKFDFDGIWVDKLDVVLKKV